MQATKFIPISRRELVPLLSDDPEIRRVTRLIHHVMRFEAGNAIDDIRRAYAPFDPDPLMGAPTGGDPEVFLDVFGQVMEDANFRRVSKEELQAAFDERSLFPLAVDIDLDDYKILRLYRRGIGHRVERHRSLGTMYRWKRRRITYYERLVVALQLKEEALAGKRTSRMEGMEPGKIYLKSFKNIPTADLEMVLPNAELRLRRLDRLLVGGPLVAGVGATIFNSINIFLAILTGAFALSLDDPYVRAFGGVLIVVGGYLWKTHAKIKTTRLKYLQTLSSGLYFRNLANNAAVIDQTLAFANEEEQKEAMLAYVMLLDGPVRRSRLDALAEAWIRRHTGRLTDFDVDDGLDSLHQLGLVHKRFGKWHAVAPDEAFRMLDQRWDTAF